jgi:hypothetical protein
MDNQSPTNPLNQKVLSAADFQRLPLEERRKLLEGPYVGLCINWRPVHRVPKRLLLAISPYFNQAFKDHDPRYYSEYWTLPDDVGDTAEMQVALSAVVEWMYALAGVEEYTPLQPYRIKTVTVAMYLVCQAMGIPSTDAHITALVIETPAESEFENEENNVESDNSGGKVIDEGYYWGIREPSQEATEEELRMIRSLTELKSEEVKGQ